MSDDVKRPLVGLLPAAGRATRLRPYRSPKELVPLILAGPDGAAMPVPVCHFALDALRRAAVDRAVLVISDDKLEVVRVLADGADYGVPLGYVVQPEPLGLTHVVACAAPWLAGADVLLALPDTVIFPDDALARVAERRRETDADLVLGVFPTEEPERLAPVELEAGGGVRAIHDKPAVAPARNTWGVIGWSPRFTAFCVDWEARRPGGAEGKLSHAMEAARQAGLDVRAVELVDGIFRDIGTPGGLAETLRILRRRGLAFADA
jgi:glucose-1-phosphate thymidylyltransferase